MSNMIVLQSIVDKLDELLPDTREPCAICGALTDEQVACEECQKGCTHPKDKLEIQDNGVDQYPNWQVCLHCGYVFKDEERS